MQTTTYQAFKITTKNSTPIQDVLVVEAPLQININNTAYTVVMRTPDNDKELVRGLLFSEDIYKSSETLFFQIDKEENGVPSIVNVTISKDLLVKEHYYLFLPAEFVAKKN